MSSIFTTPIRSAAKRQTSRGSSNAASRRNSLSEHSACEADSTPLLLEGEDTGSGDHELDHSARSVSSWRKLKQRATRFKGSVLHRNTDRGDYLRRLFLKRKMSEKFLQSLHPRISEEDEVILNRDFCLVMDADQQIETSIEYDESSFLPSKYDEFYLEDIRNEVEAEYNKEAESAKIQEIESIQKDYGRAMKGYNQFPLEVRLKNVTYTVPVDESSTKIQTVYNSSPLYPVWKFVKRHLLKCEPKPEQQIGSKNVLADISLVLKPGRQYLVLGPPGSGKSSLLRAIVGLIKPKKDEDFDGVISYNGRTLDQSEEFYIKNAFAYIDQLDQHAPRLTVQETFEFAYQCATGGKLIREKVGPEVAEKLKQAEKEHLATRLALSALGLNEVKDTFVGDESVRGVSGGQRRRVTVGEMLMARATILCGDEISTGLDAASTYDMIQVLLHYGRSHKQTRIISLLQPSPETVSLFDEVIVLAEGQIIYAGPIEEVEDHFAEIGFRSPEFCDVGDFLQMVSTEDGASLYQPEAKLKAIRPDPPNASELAEIFRNSKWGQRIVDALHRPLSYVWTETEGSRHGGEVSNLVMSEAVRKRYANRFPRSTQLIFQRFVTLWRRDKRVIIAGAVKNVLMGVSVGGVFFDTNDVLSIQGALFQAGLFIMLGSMQSSSGLIQARIIYYKHADANFYSSWPFVFGRTLSQMPQTFADTITFGTLLYYVIGLGGRDNPDAANFFIYLSILIVFAILMNAQMALYASFADAATVQVLGACTLLAMMLFCGFIIAPDDVPDYYSWVYWWNPFAWAYRALVVNEFRQGRWDDPNQILQNAGFLDQKGDAFGQVWVGYSFLYLVPYWLLCCVLSAVGLGSVQPSSQPKGEVIAKPHITNDEEKEKILFTPVTLSFHDICYEVTASTSKEQLMLLKRVNGVFRPRRLCALMGSSGAGKTTLMDVIALRKRNGIITGEVRLNGYLQDPITFRRCSGYVEQFDVQSPELTVRETVLFSARLRLDPTEVDSDEKKRAFVDQILDDVELSALANALVGSSEEGGLSFEQKKRLSIAVELAAAPSVLFLDEPTSGLDSRSASLVVKTLRRIADGDRTICATIHQPSSAVFGMFDDLLLLKKGGEVVYNGPLGEDCGDLISYFESKGAQRIALGENPANWMLRVITSYEQQDLAAMYLRSDEHAKLQADLFGIKNSLDPNKKIEYKSEFAASMSRRRELINHRLQLIYWRSPTYNLARIMVSIVIAFILGSVFLLDYGSTEFTETQMQAQLSVIFLSFIITGIMAILSVLPVMTKIRDMFYRHRDAGMYDSASMGLALGVAEKYFILLSTTLFCVVFLATSDLENDGFRGLVAFWGFFTFNFAIYSYMGQLFVCLVKPAGTAMILCSVFIGIGNFFAGLIVRPQFMVGTFYAVPYYLCTGHYVYESMVMALYTNNKKTVIATVGSAFHEFLVEPADNNCVEGQVNCTGTAEDYVLVFFGGEFSRENQLRNASILGGILVLARVLTWVALKKIRFSS